MAEESSRGAENIICELIEKSLSARTAGEQKEIFKHKKPQPKLGARTANRQFQDDWYAKKEWLCGSTNLQRLFCWPCLCLLQKNRKRGQEKDMPICVVFFPIAESMGDRTAIWKPIRNGRPLMRQKGSIFYSQEREEKRCSAIMSR